MNITPETPGFAPVSPGVRWNVALDGVRFKAALRKMPPCDGCDAPGHALTEVLMNGRVLAALCPRCLTEMCGALYDRLLRDGVVVTFRSKGVGDRDVAMLSRLRDVAVLGRVYRDRHDRLMGEQPWHDDPAEGYDEFSVAVDALEPGDLGEEG